jgi:predicted DNA binding CopG/RHH family protein
MNKEKEEVLKAMSKVPGLKIKDLTILMQNLPDAAEFEKMNEQFDAEMEIIFREELDFNPDDLSVVPQVKRDLPRPASATSSSRSAHITMRIPGDVLDGAKAKAQQSCIGYQTWINRQLRVALAQR